MEARNLLNQKVSRMTVFRLLSDCYFLPDQGLSEKLENLELHMANVCEAAVKWVQNMRKSFKADTDFELLKIDFSKLFVGPYELSAAPYGSVYLEGERKMMGDSTQDVRNRYLEAGLDTAKTFKDAPDHISAELEFMHYLIFKEIETLADADLKTAIGFVQRQKSFLEDHLMTWVPQFTTSIMENATTDFYKNLARATHIFIKHVFDHIGVSTSSASSGDLQKSTRRNLSAVPLTDGTIGVN